MTAAMPVFRDSISGTLTKQRRAIGNGLMEVPVLTKTGTLTNQMMIRRRTSKTVDSCGKTRTVTMENGMTEAAMISVAHFSANSVFLKTTYSRSVLTIQCF